MSTYRYYGFTQLTTNQVDIGGALPGDQFGVPTAQTPGPQKPDSITVGLTTTVTPNLTNDFRANYLRNWWQYSSAGAPPQLPGIGGALEIGGESATAALIPYNVNTASARQRFWDGKDQFTATTSACCAAIICCSSAACINGISIISRRDDNGLAALTMPVYQIAANAGNLPASYIPAAVPASQSAAWTTLYNEVLGIVTQPQIVYTRAGAQLNLQPAGTPVFDQSILPTYNLYFSDTWTVQPSLTITYGLGYAVEMPPYEVNGKQVALVDSSGRLIQGDQYLAQRLQAALAGQVYDPNIGFETVRNVGGGLKYPYSPYYGEVSPRVAAAWNPKFSDGPLRFFIREWSDRAPGRL